MANNPYIKIDNVSKWYPVKSGFKSKKKENNGLKL